jgi:hypothetical protein
LVHDKKRPELSDFLFEETSKSLAGVRKGLLHQVSMEAKEKDHLPMLLN